MGRPADYGRQGGTQLAADLSGDWSHTARHTAGTLLKQVSNGNKGLARLVLGHAEEDVTDRYAKDKARLLAPAVLDAWRAVLGEWYDGEPAR